MDDFLFADESEEESQPQVRNSWKVLIVDDDEEIHAVTKLALSDFEFQQRNLQFLSAYSGAQAKEILAEHDDIAVVLLDVVMETEHAGLDVARYIREEIKNCYTRIILRTGQPGQAPERHVIINYDINDYKSKTDLTAQKLFTVIISTLRSYRDIVLIDENRRGLEKIIRGSANLFSIQSLESFIEGIVQQLSSLLGGTQEAVYMTSAVAGPVPIEDMQSQDFFVFSGCGEYTDLEGKPLSEVLAGEKLVSCRKALQEHQIVYGDDHVVAYCASKQKRGALLYMSGLERKLNELDKNLIELFSQNVQVAFDNVLLTKDLEDTQREIINRLGQAIDNREQPCQHIVRVQKIAEVLAIELGLPPSEISDLLLAVPLHDVGKVAISDNILNKPGALDEDEYSHAQKHVELGYNILKGSTRPVIKTAALLARDHHEHWDGTGYPQGLKGEEIHIFSRITALASVYDVLRTERCYKPQWSEQQAKEAIIEQRGKQFDPALVDIFMAQFERIEKIRSSFPD